MIQNLKKLWESTTIKKKILMFTGTVFVVCLLSVIFNVWVVKFSLLDFSRILDENTQSITLMKTLEKEKQYFQGYVKRQENVTLDVLEEVIEETSHAVYELPYDYNHIGEERYVQTSSIRNSFEVYVNKREGFLSYGEMNPTYINDLYKLYGMQEYMIKYAKNLMIDTTEISSIKYQEKVPKLIYVSWLIVIFGCFSLITMIKLAQLMYKTIIVPVMKLVRASKRIANNDFFIEDVKVDNMDELGELVRAFNKMKYATTEFITALEEKRKTLDLLHEEELDKLEVEKQLEAIKLDLLKSQVNPHFLFNTLNVIAGMANLEDAQITEKMIKAMSSLFRYNLKTVDIEVPLMRELKVVEDYMYLQRMRFGERITYDIKCDADKEIMLVPAFTFQPLVENAIVHGLSRKEEGGKVRIRIRYQNKQLFIYIGDTGIGMAEDKLCLMKEKLKSNNLKEASYHGIGIGNIYRRVNSMYPNGKVEIYSKKNVGTVIEIVIPQRNGEAYV